MRIVAFPTSHLSHSHTQRSDSRQAALFVAALAGALLLPASATAQRLLGDVANAVPDTLVLSPDGKRFAVVTVDPRGAPRRVIVDGKPLGRTYDEIAVGTPLFSPDGKHVVFAARTGPRCYVVHDGIESDEYLMAPDGWPLSSLVYSPNSASLAYKARVDGRTVVVVNRRNFGPYDVRLDADGNRLWGVWDFRFSPDSQTFAYRARLDHGMSLCVGNVTSDMRLSQLSVSPEYESIGSETPIPVPSLGAGVFAFIAVKDGREYVAGWSAGKELRLGADYQAIARGSLIVPPHNPRGVDFIARKGDRWHAVIGGKESDGCDEIGRFMYAAGRHAFAARRQRRVMLVVDGVEGEACDGVRFPGTVFSPDGKQVAYAARKGDAATLVHNNESGPRYDILDGLAITFSPDSKRLAYPAGKDGQQFIVRDGQQGPAFDSVSPPHFSADSSRLGYRARRGLEHFIVVDDQSHGPFADVSPDSPAFSPDGKSVAFAALQKGNWQVIVNDQADPSCEGVASRLTFTKDGLVYVGRFLEAGQQVFAVVANGRRGRNYDAIWMGDGGQLLFDPAAPEYFGQRGPLVYRDALSWKEE